MNIIRKIRSFCKLDTKMKRLLIEAYIALGWARYRKSKEFSKIAPSLGEHMVETTYDSNVHNMAMLRNISSSIQKMSRYTFWESECLVKAMAGMKMLERRGIESTLYLGTGRDETGLIAHAWLRSGNFYISGVNGMEKFTVVAMFANKNSIVNFEREYSG
ncbi:lasso peptide biosynthesis B2 protein [Peribacillus asahii]|uniref:lasso peptide biosynthesis B2 protein n=1 Tax=Peribacillus asahii TaxID=228899 RepID=UPI0038080BA6